jgi:hypothetical protein
LEKAHKIRMKPKSQDGTEGVVSGNHKVKKGPDEYSMEEEEELFPEFIKRFKHFILLKWECLREGVSLDVIVCPFPKPILYKQLKEDLSMHQIVTSLSTQKTRPL